MPTDNVVRIIRSKTPDSAAMLANVKRAMAITARLNRLTFDDAGEIRALFSQLIGKEVDDSFLFIPPFFTAGGDEIRVGRNVFVNQNCTFYDLGDLDISDDVMIGPNVSVITTGHPLEPPQRRAATIGKPIVIEKGVWIAAGAIIIGGVTVGEHSVVAAGSVVTKDVHANSLVGGNPARVIRSNWRLSEPPQQGAKYSRKSFRRFRRRRRPFRGRFGWGRVRGRARAPCVSVRRERRPCVGRSRLPATTNPRQ